MSDIMLRLKTVNEVINLCNRMGYACTIPELKKMSDEELMAELKDLRARWEADNDNSFLPAFYTPMERLMVVAEIDRLMSAVGTRMSIAKARAATDDHLAGAVMYYRKWARAISKELA